MPTPGSLGAPAPTRGPQPGRPSLIPRPSQPDQAPSRAWIWGLAVLLVVAGGAVAYWQRQAFAPGARSAAAARTVRTVQAYSGSLDRSLRVAGSTAAERSSILLAPQMRGSRRPPGGGGHNHFSLTLQKLAPGGSFVKQGDVVAEFDRQYMLLRLDDYKAMVDQHDRNLARLKRNMAIWRAWYNQRMLAAKGAVDKAALDLKKIPILSEINQEKFRLNYEQAQATYKEYAENDAHMEVSEGAAIARSESDLRVTKLEYERAQRNADRMLIKAPNDGMVVVMTLQRSGTNAQIQEGDQIGSGQPIMRVVDLSGMVVNAAVNQVDAQSVRLGMRAVVRFDAYPQVELPAEVTSVGAFAQPGGWRGTYVRSVPIRLKLEKTDPIVVPDLSVSADLVVESAENSTIVPREAVFGGEDEPYAFVQEGDHGWGKRPLDVVLTNAVAVAVRSGVNPGDVLAAEQPAEPGQ